MLREHLAIASRHVAQGEQHVSRQRELIAELERNGHNTAQATQLLVQFEELLAMHIADRDRIVRELAEQPGPGAGALPG